MERSVIKERSWRTGAAWTLGLCLLVATAASAGEKETALNVRPYQGGFRCSWPDATEILVSQSGGLDSVHFDGREAGQTRLDASGRVIAAISGAKIIAFRYDRAGRLKTLIDALGMRIAFGYDARGRLTTAWLPKDIVVQAEGAR